ncbi:hypothetical protein [Novosphingobium naphthalenivorans]|uniref:hypothetical protein n=1 Tax=Novosphingobium naphthalenivorans TaxID=273168 RepID=UPI0008363CF3|nr:hypothetical protein [Novosphingobium naphthalenivorans]
MKTYEFAILGFGVFPCIVALALRAIDPDLRILLLTGDSEVGGGGLDLMLPERLNAAARAVLEPMIVREWPAYYAQGSGEAVLTHEPVVLVDPVQVSLEVEAQFPGDAIVTSCGTVSKLGRFATFRGGQAEVSQLIDLTRWMGVPAETKIVGADGLWALDLPVIAEAESPGEESGAYFAIPLGDERMAIRRWKVSEGDSSLRPAVATSDIYAIMNGLSS